jgi:hypothetical protein
MIDTHLFTLQWHSWLRHCDTSRKVASFIPDGVTRIFHCNNPSGRSTSLWSTYSLSTRNISWELQTPVDLRAFPGFYRAYILHLFTYIRMNTCTQCITVNQTLTYL